MIQVARKILEKLTKSLKYYFKEPMSNIRADIDQFLGLVSSIIL